MKMPLLGDTDQIKSNIKSITTPILKISMLKSEVLLIKKHVLEVQKTGYGGVFNKEWRRGGN